MVRSLSGRARLEKSASFTNDYLLLISFCFLVFYLFATCATLHCVLTCATLHATKVRDIEVKVVDAPGEVRCGAGFTISLTIKNWSSQQMELSLKEEQASVDAILLDGQSGSVLGTVNPAGTLVSALLLLIVSQKIHEI